MTLRRTLTPWWVRLAAKLALAPVPYRVWQNLSLFRHGDMRRGPYVIGVFEKHSGFVGRLPPEPVLLEIGPGDSIGSALIGSAIGAERTYLVDVGPYVSSDVKLYRRIACSLADAGYVVPDITRARNMHEVLDLLRAVYLTDGVRSLASIPTGSVDFAWSNSVLQHVRRGDVPIVATELRRVMKRDGVSSHSIDFRDMLGGGLNQLRMPETFWESAWVRRSGAYTNRLRISEMLAIFQVAGFSVEIVSQKKWTAPPTPRTAMSASFGQMSSDDMLTYHADVVLRPVA